MTVGRQRFDRLIDRSNLHLRLQVDKDVIEYIAAENEREKRPLLKYWCDDVEGDFFKLGS